MYDYVIVGAGSAGSVLAARLSEDGAARVLLIEAGGANRNPLLSIPMAFVRLFGDERYFWSYDSEPEAAVDNQPRAILHGRGLGGSSSINGMLYVRGHAGDYDAWAALGADGWSWDEVLPYFRRLESRPDGDPVYRGRSGPISSRSGLGANPLYEAFMAAVQEAGHPFTPDYNGASQWGVSRSQHAITQGRARRSSTLREYLSPAMARSNLRVATGATATRVLFEGRRAVGVEYLQGGRIQRALASQEVVLSAGAYKTPQLLQLSGLGPADMLREHGIAPLEDLPGVGANLQDHLGSFVQRGCSQPVTLLDAMTRRGQLRAGLRYLATGSGLLSHYPTEVMAFLKSDPALDRPDLQFLLAPFLRAPAGSSVPSGTVMERHGYCISWCQLRPSSTGSLRLACADPLAPPRVVHNYLAAEEDRACHRHAVAMAREFHAQPAFAPFREEEIDPGPGCTTPEEIDGYIRRTCHTHFHPAGTAAMGSGEMAVVDSKLRVRGIENLRVADASVMPRLVGANTNIPTIMIAEKAADMMRNRTPLKGDVLPEPEEAKR